MCYLTIPQRNTVKRSVFEKYGGKCAYCGVPLKYTYFVVEHITPHRLFYIGQEPIPFAENDFLNLNPSCHGCNRSKKNLSLTDFKHKIMDDIKLALKIFKVSQSVNYGFLTINEISEIEFYFEKVWRENPNLFPERKLLEKYF